MKSLIDTLTKSQLQDIVMKGVAHEVKRHERKAKIAKARDAVVSRAKKVKALRLRNPFTFK